MLSQDVVKLLKTQDAGYVRTMLQKTRRTREKLEEELVLLKGQIVEVPASSPTKKDVAHTYLVDTKEEQEQHTLREAKKLLTLEVFFTQGKGKAVTEDIGLDQTIEAPRLSRITEREELARRQEMPSCKQRKKHQEALEMELSALNSREADLLIADQQLELQRAKMSNSIGGMTKAGLMWKVRERKK